MFQQTVKKDDNQQIAHDLKYCWQGVTPFRPFSATKIIRQRRGKLQQTLLNNLKRRQWQKELQIALAVEHCNYLIEKQVNAFWQEKAGLIKLYAVNMLLGKVNVGNCLYGEFLAPGTIEQLVNNIKREMQVEINKYFGGAAADIAALHYCATDYDSMIVKQLAKNINEYRHTLLLAAVATKVGDEVWKEVFHRLELNPIFNQMNKKFKLGTLYMKLVGCDQKMLIRQYAQQLEQEMAGIMYNILHNLKMLIRNKIAQVFYEMYDNTYGKYFSLVECNIKLRAYSRHRQINDSQELFTPQVM